MRKHADYQRVYKTGRKQFGKQMAYFVAAQPPGAQLTGPRVGLTVPKALGKAVDRNRIKRRMRAAVRASLPLLTAARDVVLHPRRSVIEGDFTAITRELGVVFRSIQAAADRGQVPTPDPAARSRELPAKPKRAVDRPLSAEPSAL